LKFSRLLVTPPITCENTRDGDPSGRGTLLYVRAAQRPSSKTMQRSTIAASSSWHVICALLDVPSPSHAPST
jgi:hypothetical protein